MKLNNPFIVVADHKELANFQKDLAKAHEISLDTETTGLDFLSDSILLLQMKVNENIYIFDFTKLNIKYLEYIVQLIQDSGKTVIGHNIKFDIKFIHSSTGILLTNIYDTQVVEVILTAGVGTFKFRFLPTLAEISMKHLGIDMDKEVRGTFINAKKITQEQLIYAAKDVKDLDKLKDIQIEKIKALNLSKVLNLEMKLLPVVAQMEINGVLLDKEPWMKIHYRVIEEATSLRESIVSTIVDELSESLSLGAVGKNAYEVAISCKIPITTKKLRLHLEEITATQYILDDLEERLNIARAKQLNDGLG